MMVKLARKILAPFREFFKHESTSGIVLMICAIIAIIAANSPIASTYNNILHSYVTIGYGKYSLSMSVLHWINDGLMAVFFFVIGMEIKREVLVGELKDIKKTILPVAAAFSGMIIPALIYIVFNYNQETIAGWGTPMATDIAFALGILSLVGRKKAPKGLAVFLTALAIVDDLGAILVIAIFYTNQISWIALIIALAILIILILANKFKVNSVPVFLTLGLIMWVSFLKSGIHATFAGVLLGMTIPSGRDIRTFKKSMLYKLEHLLEPWSALLIMPIFALANSGVTIQINSFTEQFLNPVSLGIFLGLFLGKQLGIFITSYLLVKFQISKLPSKVTFKHLYGASLLSGIGFTMSLFIASLSFTEGPLLSTAKISIISASVVSALAGFLVLKSIKTEAKT
ncbi:Na+/H+ antiporter NhaA [Clostridium sp. A1-XYC3]|uniref:Na(+)/H(+) antiporter NhaA n=1 Tax=Clostridium tanneri TaxID=3037988 RepID=A0ABU4JS51_9CLOT|nr:Na+/H+ antiporter NhaA [Clostridium sp. A1-XYC3]MDW8800974.1 Na+/H+ antiporter NhaA [Clostridium sp. A1-XYC3]